MADKTVTPANVLASSGASTLYRGTAAVAILAGQILAMNTSQQLVLASSLGSPVQKVVGVALNNAAIGQPVTYTAFDPAFTPGYATFVGDVGFLSVNAGMVCPQSDLTTGDQPVILYVGTGTSTAVLQITAAGVVK